jgi:hypothetical protein
VQEGKFRMSGLQFVALMAPVIALFALAYFVLDGVPSFVVAVSAFTFFWAGMVWLNRRWANKNANPS